MVFHWRIFLLSRANRLYSIFLHWLEEPGVPRVSCILLSSTRNTGYGSSARYEPCSKTKFLTISAEGGSPTSVLGSQPIIWLLSPSPSGVRRPEVTKYQHICDPHSLLTVTFLTGFHCSFQREDSINLTSIVSAGYRVTPSAFRSLCLSSSRLDLSSCRLVCAFLSADTYKCLRFSVRSLDY